MRAASYKVWTVFSLLLVVVAATLVVVLGDEFRLLSVFVLPPFVAGLTTTPRRTAVVMAASLFAAIVIATLAYDALTTDNLIRIIVIFLGGLLALQASILRERDLRTRRRLALINSARAELEGADGMEENLASFARAAVLHFAEWAFLEVRAGSGDAERHVFQAEHGREFARESVPRETPTAATAAYETRAAREGALRAAPADDALLDALFEHFERPRRGGFEVMIVPVAAGDVRATYFLVYANPNPPLGEAELTQVQSLAQAAALAARSDQLIDQLTYAEAELRASRDQIAATISNIADGVVAQSSDGRLVYANEAAAEMFGLASTDELIGARFEDIVSRMEIRDELGHPFDPENMPSRRALRGEERPEALLRYVVKETGREWWTLVKARAIFAPDGTPTTAISVIEDLTEHRRAELAQRFLADAGKALNEPGDLTATVMQIAETCVPAIADWCAIDLIESDGRLRRAAAVPAPGDADEPSEAPSVALNVAATGVPELFGAETGANVGEVLKMGPAGEGMHSAIVAPLTAQGRPVGAIALALSREGTRFTEYDLETVLELGRRAGVSIAATRDQDYRERVLQTLSTSLLPRNLPSFEGLTIATRFRPAEVVAEVSGDFFDAFEMADGSVALVIGDVSGKGAEAAALTALARYTIRTDAMRESEPSAILRTLNSALVGQVSDDRFCTVALARVRSNGNGGRVIDIASGGHPLPILSGPDGARAIGESGTLLGIVREPTLRTHTAEFPKGTSLVLYTDGLAAGRTTDDVGFALGLLDGLNGRPADELASAIDEAARQAAQGPTRDDVAILVAQAD